MATGTVNRGPTPKPSPKSNGQWVEYDEFIDTQIRKARSQVKGVELAGALLTFLAGTILYLLGVALIDHWMFKGGLGFGGRVFFFAGFLVGAAWFVVRYLAPLVIFRINPIYAAQTIELGKPTLKNSLINFLFLRQERAGVNERIFHAVEEQAATNLSRTPLEATVDRTHVVHMGYLLMGVLVLFIGYYLLSPKNPLDTLGRVAMPWADIKAPTRVTIADVLPGNREEFLGQPVDVTAEIRGVGENEPVRVIYTTADHQTVDRAVQMFVAPNGSRHAAKIPAGDGGLQQDVDYRIEAGDAISPVYHLQATSAPTIGVESIDFEFPAYMDRRKTHIENVGDIRAPEGTKVTIHGRSNQTLQRANLLLEGDSHHEEPLMTLDDKRIKTTATLLLLLDDKGRALYSRYMLRPDGRDKPQPVQYQIDVFPDLPPEVKFLAPEKEEAEVPANGRLLLEIRALDPDFALTSVTLSAAKVPAARGEKPLIDNLPLMSEKKVGPSVTKFTFDAAKLNLKEGDLIEYWATARDNRQPKANETQTAHRRIHVISAQRRQPAADRANNDGNPQPADGSKANNPNGNPEDKNPAIDPDQKPREPKREGDPQQGSNNNPDAKRDQRPNSPDKANPDANPGPSRNEQDKPRDEQKPDKSPQPREKPSDPKSQQPEKGDQSKESGGQQKKPDDSGQQGSSPKQGGDGNEKSGGKSDEKKNSPNEKKQSGDQKPGDQPSGDNKSQSGQPASDKQNSAGKPNPGDSKSGDPANNGGKQDANQPKGSDKNSGGKNDSGPQEGQPPRQDGSDDASALKKLLQRSDPNKKGNDPSNPSGGGNEGSTADGKKGNQPGGKENNGGNDPGAEQPSDNPKNTNPQGNKSSAGKPDAANKPDDKQTGTDKPNGAKKPNESSATDKKPGDEAGDGKSDSGKPGDGKTNKPGDAANQSQQPGAGKNPGAGKKPDTGVKPNSGSKSPDSQKSDDMHQSSGQPGDTPQPGDRKQPGDNKQPGDKKQGDKKPGDVADKQPDVKQVGDQGANRDGPLKPKADGKGHDAQSGSDPSGQKRDPNDKSSQTKPNDQGGDPDSNKGKSGAGQASKNEDKGSPSPQEDNKPNENKHDQGTGQQPKDSNGDSPKSPSNSPKESDSAQSDTEGDRSGGGKAGGGQKAKQPGTGGAGSHSAADEGANSAPGQGKGETGTKPGDDKLSDQPTGKPGSKPGNGSGKPNDSGNPGGKSDGAKSDPAKSSGAEEGAPGKAEGGKPSGKRTNETADGKAHGNAIPDGGSGGASPATGSEGGGQGDTGDAANKEFAKKQFDLALERLKGADPKTLKDLNWSPEDAQALARRLEQMKANQAAQGQTGEKARRQMNDLLRSLGSRAGGVTRRGGSVPIDSQRGLEESSDNGPPAEYSEIFDAFQAGALRSEK